MTTAHDTLQSSLLGIMRGTFVSVFTHPLNTIKTNLQVNREAKICYTAFHLFQTRRLYSGFTHQLLQTSIKQSWCWPVITALPPLLNQFHPISQQIITGLTIATIDAATTAGIEKRKIVLQTASHKGGSKHFAPYWAKLSVSWCTFLAAQHHFRSAYDTSPTPLQLTVMGTKIALLASITTAPFDVANTLKQSNLGLSSLFSGNIVRNLYRGWPLRVVELTIHNVASVAVLELLRRNKSN